MRIIHAFGLLASFHQLADSKPVNIFASPLTEDSQQLEERTPPSAQVCKDVNLIAAIFKLNKATTFCSSFLGIKTSTISKTAIVPTAVTTTDTVLQSTNTTETVSTEWV
jgi:hypothetical protein